MLPSWQACVAVTYLLLSICGLHDQLLQRRRAGTDHETVRHSRSKVHRANTQNDCSWPKYWGTHTKAFGDGLFELRLKGAEGIARVFFCTLVGKRIVMLHSFIKKSERTPSREREVAETRRKEIKRANT